MVRVEYGSGRPPWHIRRTGFPAAWRQVAGRPTGERPIRVAVLDSGIDLAHPLLKGYLGRGANLLREGEPPADENGHGTHVAGIIALAAGAWADCLRAPTLVIHPVKIFDQTGYGRIGDIVKGLYWCAEQGVEIVNLSFGTDMKTSRALQRAVRELDRAGVLLVGAAGNDGREGNVDFPGRYPEVLAVSACTRTDRLAPFSSVGEGIDMAAPGAGVISLAPGGGFVRMSGTSMAAPHVTAAAALLLGMEPHLTPAAVRKRMADTAEWLPTVPGRAQGAGLLRADRCLRGRVER
ncbi:MAG TPA: S8 family serine peptidase [Symbiobacteriaceae bacterium]|nr:S8 family serine peptidase [Symbiobacteriaceae bacterium]